MLDYLPVINQDQVHASLGRLAEALRESQTPPETPELEECQIGEKNTTDRSKRQPADGQVSAVPADKNPQDVTVGGSDNLSPALVWMLVGLLLAGSLLVIYRVAFWVSGSSFARRRLRTRQFHASPRSTNW